MIVVVGLIFLAGLLWLRAKDSQIKTDNTAAVTYIGSKDGARTRMVHPSRTRYGYVHPSYMLGFPTTTRLSPLLCTMACATYYCLPTLRTTLAYVSSQRGYPITTVLIH